MCTLLLVSGDKAWPAALRAAMPELEVRHFPEIGDRAAIEYALVWMPDLGLLASLPRLKVVFSIAAGVDHILRDPSLPPDVPIVRMSDSYQASMMAEYATMAVLHYHRFLDDCLRDQARATWTPRKVLYTPETTVGILGMGDIGQEIARRLAGIGFRVRGWTRTPRSLAGVTCHHGADGLAEMLPHCQHLICVLPITPATRGLIDAKLLAALPRGASVINLGRGAHLVEEDLLAALDSGHIRGAFLDVFAKEPLPAEHPFWRHPRVVVTPHMGGELLPRTAAASVVANIRRHRAGEPLTHVYDRGRGY
jgi:glyoxylate/hydroxypyruvate reductase A